MTFFGLIRELKRRLRRKRRWILLGTWLILIGLSVSAGWFFTNHPNPDTHDVLARTIGDDSTGTEADVLRKISKDKTKHRLMWERQYVCGEESQFMGEMDSEEVLKFYEKHPEAFIAVTDNGTIIITELVNDLSPECKDNTYFGLDAIGNLSLFNGLPQDEKVIRTFFQLNVQYLESSLPREAVEQLYNGIRVTDLAGFNSVLSTFSDYAVEGTESVMSSEH